MRFPGLKNKQLVTLSVVLAGLLLAWSLSPVYIRNALVHMLPGIYDYRVFHGRVVQNSIHQPWPRATGYNSFSLPLQFVDSLYMMRTTAFLVTRDDSILFEYYADGAGETEISNSFSVAKGIVALLTGCALADGYIDSLDQEVDEFLQSYPGLLGEGLTIRDLLTMSSGSDWDEDYNSLTSITTKAYYGDDLPLLMQRVRIESTPGTIFEYKSGDTQLLAMVLSEATGRSISDYFSERIWQPVGAESPGVWSIDREGGVEKAFCCFNSHARDFARLGKLVLDRGKWMGEQLVPRWFIDEMVMPATYLVDVYGNQNIYHGFKWWVMQHAGHTIPYTRGILGQYIFVIPSKNAVVVRLGHERSMEQINEHPADAFTWVNLALEVLNQAR